MSEPTPTPLPNTPTTIPAEGQLPEAGRRSPMAERVAGGARRSSRARHRPSTKLI